MHSKSLSVDSFLESVDKSKIDALSKLRDVILANLPEGFEEQMAYGMPSYVVPHSVYSAGYHCDPKQPLPFISFAAQKNFISFYHMGMYADKNLLNWFLAEYPKYLKTKPDVGKSCVRFKKPEQIPFDLIGRLVKKMGSKEWIATYEKLYRK